jgi:hypothetical protein
LTAQPAEPADVPRAVRRGPPITVTCECGEKRELGYGERWRCERCGRRYDTNRIPMEEYASLRRARVHDRILPSAIFALVVAVVIVFVAIGRPLAAIIVVPTIAFLWGTFIRPKRRRRQLKAIAERPRWQIRAD